MYIRKMTVYIPYSIVFSHVNQFEGLNHRLMKITDRTLDVVFSRFGFKITLRQNKENKY